MKHSYFHALWIGGFIIINIFLWKEVWNADTLNVTFFDVGQGDAALIETPRGTQILVDGGPNGALMLEKLGKAMPFWDRTIDLVILSHPAQDHVEGLVDVLKKYRVSTVFWTGIEKETTVFKRWKETLLKEEAQGARVVVADAPQKISWKKKGACSQQIDILYPKSLENILVKGDDNDTSLVARFAFCDTSVLFTGDLTKKGEEVLLLQNVFLGADILKVGHHGSKTSSTPQFVQAVRPGVAVISAGKNNSYGHPHKETLATFQRYGIHIRRTDEEGDIVFKFNIDGIPFI